MGHAHTSSGIVVIHHHGDGTLGRPLSNGNNIDVCSRQRGKEFRGDTAQGAHAITDDRDNRQMLLDGHRLQQFFFQLEVELLLQRPAGAQAVHLRYAEADAVFGRGLGDQHHRDAVARHGREHACRHAHHAFHPRTRDVEHRHVVEVRDTFNRQAIVVVAGPNQRAWRLWIAGVFNQAWDLELGDRGNGTRVKHFGAEVGKLHRLLIRHRLQQAGIRHLTRVTGIHTVHVSPDLATVGTQTGGQYGGRVVRAVTAQHHQLPFFIPGGETRHQDHMISRDFACGNAAGRFGNIYGGFEVMTNSEQFFDRIDHRDVMATSFQQTRHNGDREFFTAADQCRVNAVRALPQQTDTMQNVFNLGKFLLNKSLQLSMRKAGLGVRQALQQVSEDLLCVADVHQCILPPDGFFNHCHQMVGNFSRGREYRRHLPLPGIALQDVGNTQKSFCICH